LERAEKETEGLDFKPRTIRFDKERLSLSRNMRDSSRQSMEKHYTRIQKAKAEEERKRSILERASTPTSLTREGRNSVTPSGVD